MKTSNISTCSDNLTGLADVSPLDNSTDLGFESHQRMRTGSTLFNHFLNRVPTNNSDLTINSNSNQNQRANPVWREVAGEWLNQQNSTLNPSELTNHADSLWYDADHMDVPLLLNTTMDDHNLGREMETWDHCHQRTNESNKSVKARNQLISASVLCLIFMIAEAIGGYLSNSLAVMSDAAHMLSDFTSFLVSLFALWVSSRSPTKKMSYGYYRAEILGALFSILIIWILTGILVYVAVDRLIHKEFDIDADTMIIVSSIGVAMNIAMGVILHGGFCNKLDLVHHGHSHGIGPSHGHSHSNGAGHSHAHGHSHGIHSHGEHSHNENRNMNVRAALIHVIGDLVQSIGVLIAAIVIKYWPECSIADPICTFLFSGLVLATTIGLIRDAAHVLMEGVPRDIEHHEVRQDLKAIESVCSVHSLHIWSLTLDRNALTVHLAISSMAEAETVLKSATKILQTKYKITHSTVQVERYNPSTMEICPQCTSLTD